MRSASDQLTQADDEAFARIVDEINERLQNGFPLELDVWIERHPQYGERLQRLYPALEALIDLGVSALRSWPNGATALRETFSPDPGVSQPQGVLGDFRIVREIGRGGMGVVYEAEQVSLRRRVALKVLPFASMLDPRQLQRFHNEAIAAARLHHTNIVPVHGTGCERGVHYYAMQYIEGHTLAEAIAALRRSSGMETVSASARPSDGRSSDETRAGGLGGFEPLSLNAPSATDEGRQVREQSPSALNSQASGGTSCLAALSTEHASDSRVWFRRVAEMGLQLAEALDYAHRMGIIHRDVKPANILLDPLGTPWITDFGLAQLEREAGLTVTGDLLGTLRYMSPEQADRGAVDHRTDVYSLGVTLYELLTLRPAFAGVDRCHVLRQVIEATPPLPSRIRRPVPAELETIVLKAIEKSPAERYATAGELADDLRRFLDHRPIHARRTPWIGRVRKWCRRNRVLVTAAAILVTLGLLGLLVGSLLVSNERNKAAWERTLRRQAEEFADSGERMLREHRYVTRINLAARAWDRADFDGAVQHLQGCCPGRGEPDLRGFEWRYLWRAAHTRQPALGRHEGQAYFVRYSPDGRRLASAGQDGVRIWNALTGEQEVWLRDHTADVNWVEFSSDGRHLVSAGDDRDVLIRDAITFKIERTIRTAGAALAGAFSPDGSAFAVAEREHNGRGDSRITLYDASTWTSRAVLMAERHRLGAMHFSPDGALLAAASHGLVRVWDVATEERIADLKHYDAPINSLAFAPTRDLIVSVGGEGFMHIWHMANWSQAPPEQVLFADFESISFAPGHLLFATASRDGMIRLWELSRERHPVCVLTLRDTAPLWCVTFSPDGDRLASVSHDGSVKQWNLRDLQQPARIALKLPDDFGELKPDATMAFSPSGSQIAVGLRSVCICNTRTGAVERTLAASSGRVHALAFSPDGRLLAAGHDNGRTTFWDTSNWQPVPRLAGIGGLSSERLPSVINHLAFSADSTRLILCRHDPAALNSPAALLPALMYDLHTAAELPLPVGREPSRAHFATFSADGRWLALIRHYGDLDIHDLVRNQSALRGDPAGLVAFSPDSRLLATASESTVRIRETATWKERTVFASAARPWMLAFSADGRTLFESCMDRTIRLWNVATGRELLALPGGGGRIAVSPDGTALAYVGTDSRREVRLWRTAALHRPSGTSAEAPDN